MKAIKEAVAIHIDDVDAIKEIIDNILAGINYEYIGSIGKKQYSSDVDVIVEGNPVDTISHLFPDAIHKPGFKLISIGVPFKNNVIQLDVFYTDNMEWSRFIYSGDKNRNQLLMAALICRTKIKLDQYTYQQSNIRLTSGVWDVTKTTLSKTGKPIKTPRLLSETFLSADPKYIYNELGCKTEDYSFEYLWNRFRYDQEIMDKFKDYQSNN